MTARKIKPPRVWEPLKSVANVLAWLLAIDGAIALVDAALQIGRAVGARDRTFPVFQSGLRLQSIISPLWAISSPLGLAVAVMWLIWQHRAQTNLWARGVRGLRFTPGWVVGWWFVPFANFVQPLRAMRELGRHAGPTTPSTRATPAGTDGWLWSWWLVYLAVGVLGVMVLVPFVSVWIDAFDRLAPGSRSLQFVTFRAADLRAIAGWMIGSDLARALAAALAVQVVLTISRAEDALGSAGAFAGIPPRPDLW